MGSNNLMRNKRLLQSALWLGLAALPLQALGQSIVKRGTPVRHGNASWTETYEWTAPAREGGKLILRADMGSVEITPGAGNQLEGRVVLRVYTGSEEKARRVFDAYRLSARSIEGGGVYVSGELSGSRHHDHSAGAEFDIKLPARFNLDVETQGGDIGVEGALQGEARPTTAGGDIHTTDISGPIRVETAGGGITLGNLGARAEARTAGGSIHVGNVRGDAMIETSGGEIQVGQVGGTLRAETAGGDVVIAGLPVKLWRRLREDRSRWGQREAVCGRRPPEEASAFKGRVAELWRKRRVAALISCSSRQASEPAHPQDASWRSSTLPPRLLRHRSLRPPWEMFTCICPWVCH